MELVQVPFLEVSRGESLAKHLDRSRMLREEGHVVLRGQVRSFYQTQMAQESVRHIDGITSIDNCLEVID